MPGTVSRDRYSGLQAFRTSRQILRTRYAWVSCSPKDRTPLTRRFLSTRFCPSPLGSYTERESEKNFSKEMDWAGRNNPFAPTLHLYNTTRFFLSGWGKGPGISSKNGCCDSTSCKTQQWSCYCDTPDGGKHMVWIRVPFGHFTELQMAPTLRCIGWIVGSIGTLDLILRHTKEHTVSETRSVSVLRWWPRHLLYWGPLGGASLHHWTTYVCIITAICTPETRLCQWEITGKNVH
jgi:hypothetical protein